MEPFDIARFAAIATYGVGLGFMILTNVIAFRVLRPPKQLGFLWWHVTSISLSFACLGLISVEHVVGRLGNPPTWRTPIVLIGTTLFAVAQVIIFRVERRRLVNKKAAEIVREAL